MTTENTSAPAQASAPKAEAKPAPAPEKKAAPAAAPPKKADAPKADVKKSAPKTDAPKADAKKTGKVDAPKAKADTPKAKAEPEKPKGKSGSSALLSSDQVRALEEKFEFDFLPIPEGREMGKINPKDIFESEFDARSAPAPIDEDFISSIEEHDLIQPPVTTYVREKKTNKVGYLMVAGRRRRRGAIAAGKTEINIIIRPVKNFTEYLILATIENLERLNMSIWDECVAFAQLQELGLKVAEIAKKISRVEGYVSQRLAILKLDERVQKLVRQDKLGDHVTTKVRDLNRLSDDPEMQVRVAQEVVEKRLSAKALSERVSALIARKAEREAAAGKNKKGKKVTMKVPEKVASSDLAPVKKADLASLYNFYTSNLARLKTRPNIKSERLSYEEGRIEGFKQASGLGELPDLATYEAEEKAKAKAEAEG